MGKRRIRNLHYLGHHDILAFDIRGDRLLEAKSCYGIATLDSLDSLDWNKITHVIVSTPPDQHADYALEALQKNKHVFIEASVVDDKYEDLIKLSDVSSAILAPSCTMRFDPLNILLKEWLEQKKIGKLLFSQHHFGLYLPKWHPYESIFDFYVSKRNTGAAREIVPFDLVYLSWFLGEPKVIQSMIVDTGILNAEIDDIYALTFQTKKCKLVQMTVDVLSQNPYRSTRIIGQSGNIELDTVNGTISLFDSKTDNWVHKKRTEISKTKSTEEMYINELRCFIDASVGKANYDYSIRDDRKILNLLYAAEQSARAGKRKVIK